MKTRFSSLPLPLALAVLAGVPLLGGCVLVAAGAGAGGALYVTGDLQVEVPQDPPEVARAAKAALEALDLPVVTSRSSSLDAVIESRNAADKKITIKAKGGETGGSKISIRVGTFGDEAQSRRILSEIQSRL